VKAFLRMQPTFVLEVPGSADEAVTRLRQVIQNPECGGWAESAGRVIDFKIAKAEQRFWSPHLSVQIGDLETSHEFDPIPAETIPVDAPRAHLVARFSPRPEVWTMFMAIYFSTTICMFAAAIYAYVQWAMGAAPWALIGLPIGTVMIATLHLASLIGQGLSSDQMALLRERLDHTIAAAFITEADHRDASQPVVTDG